MFFSGIADEAGRTIDRQIAAHQALGWTHIELRNVEGKNFTDVDDDTFARVVDAVEAAGITVCCFASQLANWGRPISTDFAVDQQELARAIPRMHRLGTRFIRCMSYPNAGLSEDEWRDAVVARMQTLARMAEDGGVTLVHENCNGWGGESPEHTLELLERVNSPALKLVYDTGNPFAHKQDAVAYLRAVIDHVVHVHIKDGYLDGEKNVFTYPGEGSCNVGECLRLLVAHGYDAGYSIEPHIGNVIHTGDLGGAERDQLLWDSYTEYGRRLMALYAKAAAAV
jgi:sugar phosphate isomerase/epimerase